MSRQTILTLLGLAIVACGEQSQLSQDEVVLAAASANPVAALASAAGHALAAAPLLQDTAKTVTRRIWADADLYDLSPDGRLAVQTDWTTGDLAIRDMATGEVRHLTHNSAPFDQGEAEDAKFSCDGAWVAYTWYDISEPGYKLGIVDIAGRNPRLIYTDRETTWIEPADWSPDGQYILASRTVEGTGAAELLLISSADGSARVLKSVPDGLGGNGSFSPDGRYVAFSLQENDEAGSDIFAVNVATGAEQGLIQHPADDQVLGWAPDGRHVLFQSDRSGTPGAWLLPVTDGKPNGAPWLVKPDMWRTAGLRFADDGTYYYTVNTGRTDVYVASFDPASHSVIGAPSAITARSVEYAGHAFWSPDGRHLAYNVSSQDHPYSRIVVRSMETGDTKEFGGLGPGTSLLLGGLGWLADGHSLVVLAPMEAEGDRAAYQLDVQTGHRSLLRKGPDFPLQPPPTAPEAEYWIYEKSERNGQGQWAYRMVREHVETGDTTVLFRTSFGAFGQILGERLSPDGKTVAFGYDPPEGSPKLVLLPIDGGEPTQLDIERTTSRVAWMPDGQALLLQRLAEVGPVWEVLYLDLSEEAPHPIGITTRGQPGLDIDPQGRRIAYASGTDGSELWVMENFLPEAASRR
jgi:Tol biopolymer transport system component